MLVSPLDRDHKMYRRTKIVATIGPASAPPAMLERLVLAGVNVFRLNFSHGDAADHVAVAESVRAISARHQRHVALLGDLQGPKIRIGRFAGGPVMLEAGARLTLDAELDEQAGTVERVGLAYKGLIEDCQEGDTLLLDDGLIEVEVEQRQQRALHCRVVTGGRLSDNKGINRKGGGLSAPALTDKDRADIQTAVAIGVDFLALSFPRHADDVNQARQLYVAAGGEGGIVAKIERAEAVNSHAVLDDIIRAADGVMVARGDLAVEIGDAELLGVQKHIIQRARELDRFVITATQMMESMIHNPQPTRAEVSDVANAVLDGTDAVMLSGETAVGKYPVETVTAMDRIIRGAEKTFQTRMLRPRPVGELHQIDEAIAVAAMTVANQLDGVKAIVALTETGNTPGMMSRIRSGLPIFAFTPHERTLRRMAMYRGVETVKFDTADTLPDVINQRAVDTLLRLNLVAPGDKVIVTKGDYMAAHGGTNVLKIISVPEVSNE